MDAEYKQVFQPQTLQELFSIWHRLPMAVLYGGGTNLNRSSGKKHTLELPSTIISMDRIPELRAFTRTERYIEIGSMIKFNEILNVEKMLPPAFAQAIIDIAGPEVRNLATIGGNICNPTRHSDAAAPLIALDARYELRSAQNARWISASRFSGSSAFLSMNPQEVLTRIRIPLEQWHYSVYKKFENHFSENEYGGAVVFLARIQKNIVTDIRIVYAGNIVLRDKDSEAALSGKHYPLEKRDASHFMELWETYLASEGNLPFLTKIKMLGFIESSLRDLSDY